MEPKKLVLIFCISSHLLSLSADAAFPPASAPAEAPTNAQVLSSAVRIPADIKQLCDKTDYPDLCIETITPFLNSSDTDALAVLNMHINAAEQVFQSAMKLAKAIPKPAFMPTLIAGALDVCIEMYDEALYGLEEAKHAIENGDAGSMMSYLDGIGTDVETCDDAFSKGPGSSSPLKDIDGKINKIWSNMLAIAEQVNFD
ncbi:Pectinesterase inhibitor domain [Dillenia turbinata]|uniref:Pectinesterase inhibitor domain n=1 Tax=Dillenia turbinata TaxID=194707 RepID=A0AAN8ZP98_9MAGN